MASYEFIQQDQNVSLKSTRQVNNNINVQKVILSTCIFSFKFNCTKLVSLTLDLLINILLVEKRGFLV